LMGLHGGRAALTKLILPEDNPLVGQQVGELDLAGNTALVTVVRRDNVIVPQPHDVLEAGDEMLFIGDSSPDLSNNSD
jgi:trk system potassium uptake protein